MYPRIDSRPCANLYYAVKRAGAESGPPDAILLTRKIEIESKSVSKSGSKGRYATNIVDTDTDTDTDTEV